MFQKSLIFITTIALLPSVLFSQDRTFEDKSQNMRVQNIDSWRFTRVDKDKYKFKGLGKPLFAEWKTQSLSVYAHLMEGVVEKGRSGLLQLKKGILQGDVKAKIVSQDPSQKSNRTTYLECPHIDYDQDQSKIILSGEFSLRSEYPKDAQSILLTGKSGILKISPLNKNDSNILREGSIKGPVTLKIESLIPSRKDPSNRSKVIMDVRANQLNFSGELRKIDLLGDVLIDGSQEAIVGKIKASKASLLLNEKRQIIDLEFTGEPGQSAYFEQKKLLKGEKNPKEEKPE